MSGPGLPAVPALLARGCLAILAGIVAVVAAPETVAGPPGPSVPSFRKVTLELPGPPAAVVPADLDGDGLTDLLAVLVHTRWDQIGWDQVEGFVHITTIVPALLEEREARAWRALPDGSYAPAAPPLPLPTSVLSVEAGPPGMPAIALTDEGLSVVRLRPGARGVELALEPLVADPPVLRGSGTLLSGLGLVRELDGEGPPDLLLPALDGPAVYRGAGPGVPPRAAARLRLPADRSGRDGAIWRRYPLPEVQDVDGDGRPDLVVASDDDEGGRLQVLLGAGEGLFERPRRIPLACLEASDGSTGSSDLAYFGDVDGEGRAEVVLRREQEGEDDGLKEAKEPRATYLFHRLRPDLAPEPAPYLRLEVVGHGFGGEWPELSGDAFQDLDGDGRRDMVTVTLDFSLMQVVRVLATKKFGMELRFHVWAQGSDGRFRAVPDIDLSEKLLVDLDDMKLGRLANFTADFDGDGLRDFARFGRGRMVDVHLGRPGCSYAERPDFSIDLEAAPPDPALVKTVDLNGDGASDLMVVRPAPTGDPDVSSSARLELHLSGRSR